MKIKHILFLFFVQVSLFATTLLTYNTYDRDDRVDLMLSFDTPYNGKIFLKKEFKNHIITIDNVIFDKTITKNINSKILQEIQIIPNKKNLQIIFKTDKDIGIIASKTTDGFGLRIRATILNISKQNNFQTNTKQIHKQSIQDDTYQYKNGRYYAVLIILLILILFLFYIKRKTTKQLPSNWLFKNGKDENDIKILYRKAIDSKNSAVILEYKNIKYLILTGNSNQLLDKFVNDKPIQDSNKDEDFEKIFAQNREKLDEFLKVGNDKLSNYREKVSQDDETTAQF